MEISTAPELPIRTMASFENPKSTLLQRRKVFSQNRLPIGTNIDPTALIGFDG